MELLAFAGWLVAVTAVVTLPFPLNVPLMALAYKVRRGSEPVDFDAGEYWTRAAIAAAGPAALSLLLLALGYGLVVGAEFPAGAALLTLFLAYLPAAVAYVTWAYGFDEMIDGLSVFLAYILLPGLPLLLIGWLVGLWRFLAGQLPWLFPA